MKRLGEELRQALESAAAARLDATERCRLVAAVMTRQLREKLTAAQERAETERTAYYLSAEYLLGRMLRENLRALGVLDAVEEALQALGGSLSDLEALPDAGLGSGGLGRLAACFLDSAANTGIPLAGYGIRYRYGLFAQHVVEGGQHERADDWQREGDPLSVRREAESVLVTFGEERIRAVPFDTPIVGEGGGVTWLRLWQAEAVLPFDFALFSAGRYADAVAAQERASRRSAVLYPSDETEAGRQLRLEQQYFLCDATVEDILRRYGRGHGEDYTSLADATVIQLNDTHPTWAIPAMLDRLMQRGISFDDALASCRRIFAYTNHTVMREALEVWDASLVERTLPQLWEILVRLEARLRRESAAAGLEVSERHILDGARVNMANLASYVCFSINGVARLHTELLRTDVLRAWYAVAPEKFSSRTNGVTPRRWLTGANPALASFITERIGDGWKRDAARLAELKKYADDRDSLRALLRVKQENKKRLARVLTEPLDVTLDPSTLYDIQIKRIHEYKRQLMNAFSIYHLYTELREGALPDFTPTTFMIAGKAAPGYRRAKAILRYILALSEKIGDDPAVRGKLRLVFVPNYSVSLAEVLIPAGDLSEQISMAGTEASGTGNMKFMMNGALTLGTLDGANIEIGDAAGEENNYFFGADAQTALARDAYDPRALYESDAALRRTVDSLIDGAVPGGEDGGYRELYDSLVADKNADCYRVLGDFAPYLRAKLRAMADYREPDAWARRCLMNIASSGVFSSDRTVGEYARDIWRV